MEFEVIAIGDEVLAGYTTNSNASFISQELFLRGFLPLRHEVVRDDPEAIVAVLRQALQHKRVVITTGGLGPTLDDLTLPSIAELFGTEEALLLANELGSAPGRILEDPKLFPGSILIALPGVPEEMKVMFVNEVIPFLEKRFEPTELVRTMHFVGLREQEIDPTLRKLKTRHPEVTFGIYPGMSMVSVRLRAINQEMLFLAYTFLREKFRDQLFESASGTLSEALHHELIARKLTLAAAESCTGGALSSAFVQNAGASAYFQGAVVAYSNEVKADLLGVDLQVIEKFGAVSQEVTEEMAQSAKRLFKADLAIAISGIMGPEGGSKEKPVGTIAATIAYNEKPSLSWTMQLKGTRQILIDKTVQALLARTLIFLRSLN